MYRVILLLVIQCITSFAFAQDELYNSLSHSNYEPSYISMFCGLIIVVCLIYITGIVYKKMTKIKLDNTTLGEYDIEIVSCASLGQNKNLYVIKVDSNYSLIGATCDKISYLKDLGEDSD